LHQQLTLYPTLPIAKEEAKGDLALGHIPAQLHHLHTSQAGQTKDPDQQAPAKLSSDHTPLEAGTQPQAMPSRAWRLSVAQLEEVLQVHSNLWGN